MNCINRAKSKPRNFFFKIQYPLNTWNLHGTEKTVPLIEVLQELNKEKGNITLLLFLKRDH